MVQSGVWGLWWWCDVKMTERRDVEKCGRLSLLPRPWWYSCAYWWTWCDVKMVERRCWNTREIECNSMAHCNNVCGFWQTVIFLWDVLMHAFWPLWVFHMKCHAFRPLSQSRLFQNGRGLGCWRRGDAKAIVVWPWCSFLMRFHAFWLPNFLLMV
jgi:hypothetical protein